jgi:hypothetical protein
MTETFQRPTSSYKLTCDRCGLNEGDVCPECKDGWRADAANLVASFGADDWRRGLTCPECGWACRFVD